MTVKLDDREAMAWQAFLAERSGDTVSSDKEIAERSFMAVDAFLVEMHAQRTAGQR